MAKIMAKMMAKTSKSKGKNSVGVDEAQMQLLVSRGFKRTHQRDTIIELFFSTPHRHFRIEELLELCRKKDSTISYATIYRTLMLLVDLGIAHQRQFGKGQSLFEPVSSDHHDHLICTQCSTIVEFEDDEIEKLQDAVAKKLGFKLVTHKMELYGLCPECQKNERGTP